MLRLNQFLIPFLAIFICSCSNEEENKKLTPISLFEKIDPKISGLAFTNILAENENFNLFTWLYIYNGAGVASGDINNDGLLDIYFVSNIGPNKLFLNKGNMEFEDISLKSKADASQGYKTGVTMVDINGDGWLDIYLCRSVYPNATLRRNLVYINNKDLTFSERGIELGLVDSSYSTQAIFLDIDQDNDLDLYLVNHPSSFSNATNIQSNRDEAIYKTTEGNILFENVNGRFMDISDKAGVDFSGFGLSGFANDFNEDGLMDIYVANDFIEPDLLYINNGNQTFTESASKYFSHSSQNSMGCDMADINNDGLLDMVVTDMLAESNLRQKVFDTNMKINRYEQLIDKGYGKQLMSTTLFLANKSGKFSEIGQLAGIEKSDWSWSPIFSDFNGDGWSDLLITNGITRDMGDKDFIDFRTDSIQKAQKKGINAWTNKTALSWLKLIPTKKVANHLYINNGDLTFSNQAANSGLDDDTFSQGAVIADLDNDGDPDIIISNQGNPAILYENNASSKLNRLKITLRGPQGNTHGIGSKVTVISGDFKSAKIVSANRGFLSSPPAELIFNLTSSTIDSLIIHWSDGLVQLETSIIVQGNLNVGYDRKKQFSPDFKPRHTDLISEALAHELVHKENTFDDFKRQPLLINTNSKEGPALAIEKDKTLFFGGAFEQESRLLTNNLSIKSSMSNSGPYEDTDALFFDVDNDGDQDLYVVSGGTRHNQANSKYNDRFYLNEQGAYSLSQIINTKSSGSVVTQADYNKDGFMDLFIGSGHTPGYYPQSPYSYFLVNSQGKLIISDSLKMGNVKDAAWADINKDGFPDLVAVGEWMPISVFINDTHGHFSNETESLGLSQSNGLWQSLILINDGSQIDIIAGNYGLNTHYDVSPNEPLTSYTFDFDNNESEETIVTQFLNRKEWPIARKEIITSILPSLKKRYLTNHAYAQASMIDLFGEEKVQNASKTYVYELRSGVFSRNSEGKYDFKPLHNSAQLSPINDWIYMDFDEDGIGDLCFAAGMEYTEVEQGPFDALSIGLLLLDKRKSYDNRVKNILTGKAIKKIEVLSIEEKLILGAENNGTLKTYKVQ